MVGGLLAVLLLVIGWVASVERPDRAPGVGSSPSATPRPSPSPTPTPTTSAGAPTEPPRPGAAYPVRRLGELGDRSRLVTAQGSAELRFGRPPGGATRLHFICTGCDDDTWLSERVGGRAAGPGRVADPSYVTAALDTGADGRRRDRTSRLLVKAPAAAGWTVTLTPFDEIPLHRTSFDGLDDDVVAVQAGDPLLLGCPGPSRVRVLARPSGAAYVEFSDEQHEAGSYAVPPVVGAVRLVLVVTCSGRWSLTLP